MHTAFLKGGRSPGFERQDASGICSDAIFLLLLFFLGGGATGYEVVRYSGVCMRTCMHVVMHWLWVTRE